MKKALTLLVFGMALLSTAPAWCEKIVVVFGRTLPPYQEALQGFQHNSSYDVVTFNLEGNSANAPQVIRDVNAASPDGVLVFGAEALNAVKNQVPNLPLIYTMVVEQPESFQSKMGGVVMQIPVSQQLDTLHRLLPLSKKVGVLYNPVFTAKAINEARAQVDKMQLTLVPIAVEKQSEIHQALEKMKEGGVDVLWSVLDKTAAQPAAVEEIIKYSLENKLPFIGLTNFHVKAGALAALSVDFSDLGAQTAVLARQILQGSANGRVEMPRKIIIYLNTDTQKRIGLKDLSLLPEVQVVK
jgi:putative tryptophan/tyrosine transport system substrate-binding protein